MASLQEDHGPTTEGVSPSSDNNMALIDRKPSTHYTGLSGQMTAVDEFHLFPKLPIEIRLKIWKTAFRAPQIQAFSCSQDAGKNFKATLLACSEAFNVGTELRKNMSWWATDYQKVKKHYFDLTEDTVFLFHLACLNEYIAYCCGKCGPQKWGSFICPWPLCEHMRIGRLAVWEHSWARDMVERKRNPDGMGWGDFKSLLLTKVKELQIVVGHMRPTGADFALVKPRSPPSTLLKLKDYDATNDTWEELKAYIQQDFESYDAKRAAYTQSLLQEGTITPEDLDDPNEWEIAPWEIPSITFLEAVPVNYAKGIQNAQEFKEIEYGDDWEVSDEEEYLDSEDENSELDEEHDCSSEEDENSEFDHTLHSVGD